MTHLEKRAKLATMVTALAAMAALEAPTPEQLAEYEKTRADIAALKAQIERGEQVAALQHELGTVPAVPRGPEPQAAQRPAMQAGRRVVENPGFESAADFLRASFAHIFNRDTDPKIRALMEMNDGTSGGIAVPDVYNPMLRQIEPSAAIVRPRATIFPAGSTPDAELTMPALNQGSSANMYGGVAVAWTAEGGTKPETNAKLREVTWRAHEVAGHIVVTDKLLRNWSAATQFLDKQLRGALLAAEDVAFLTGNGNGKPQGILGAACTVAVNRTTASTVKYADLVAMEANLNEDSPAVWVVAKRAIPKLRLMEDTAGQLIWQDNARTGGVPTLLGREVVTSFRSPALGSKGDVMLCDLSQYCIKEGAGLQIAASPHVYWTQNKTVIKAFMTVDGAPWLDGKLRQEDGQDYSPFVVLDAPA